MRTQIVFYLNGIRQSVPANKANLMLAQYLRYQKFLTGTKIVCEEGDCGACSVLKITPYNLGKKASYTAFNSCIAPLAVLDGASLVTVDAISSKGALNEVQKSLVECHGSQCGFCTPGFVVSLCSLSEKKKCSQKKGISKQEAKNALTGNLCRCTGYESIIEAATTIDLKKYESLKKKFYTQAQEDELLEISQQEILLESEDFTFYAPTSIKKALNFLEKNPQSKILGNFTDLGVIQNKYQQSETKVLSLHLITDLYSITKDKDTITIGARVTIEALRDFIDDKKSELSSYLDIFASPQIKNMATVVGNIANASPIGDLPTVLMALDAKLSLCSTQGTRQIALKDFFISYKKTKLEAGEIISHISFSISKKPYLKFYKNSTRKDLDISAVNFALSISEDQKEIKIAAGGVAEIPLFLEKTASFLSSTPLCQESIDKAASILQSEFTPLSDHRASAGYRRAVIDNYFRRSFQSFLEQQ